MAALTPVVLDFESFWSPTHSLSKMNPISYVMHPETEVISMAAKIGNYGTDVLFGEENIGRALSKIDWSDKLVVAHNMSGFDAMILAWRFGVKPKMWGCTLAMARPIHAKTTGLSLAKLVEHYGLGVKDNAALLNTKGRHLKDFSAEEVEAMRKYNREDTEQCAGLFKKLLPLTSKDEMRLIDMTIRMLVEPQFEVDTELLKTTLTAERARKQQVLVDLATMTGAYTAGMTDEEAAEAVCKTLGSAVKFGELLRDLGVATPMKPSPSNPDKQVPALAKTDPDFIALTEHEDPVVAAAANARLGVKSTMLESRTEAFLEVSAAVGGKMPIAISYYGAETTGRDSGTFGLNQQNMPRVNPREPKPADALRCSLRAPHGHKVVVADLSGIELRVNMFLWKVPYAMELFGQDPEADLYKPMASEVLSVPIEEITKMQRQSGKAMHLGCGFGLGTPSKYVAVAKQMAQIDVSVEDAVVHIATYRAKHPEIADKKTGGWRLCHNALTHIYLGNEVAIDPWGMCWTCKEGIRTPVGMIRYPNLREEERKVPDPKDPSIIKTKKEWVYGEGRHKARIYAGKVTENIVQHLARGVIMGNAIEVRRQTGRNTALRVHDELVYVTPEAKAQEHLDLVQSVMRTPPKWWPELVVWSEGDIADTYGAAK